MEGVTNTLYVVYYTNIDDATTNILCYCDDESDADIAIEQYARSFMGTKYGIKEPKVCWDAPCPEEILTLGESNKVYAVYETVSPDDSIFLGKDMCRIYMYESDSPADAFGVFGIQATNRCLNEYLEAETWTHRELAKDVAEGESRLRLGSG
jgi:hypothetical protein